MRRIGLLLLALVGCAEESEVALQPHVPQQPPVPVVADAYPIHQAREIQTRPPLERPRSISLGEVGNEPLPGGVMRDTPMMPPEQMGSMGRGLTWQQYITTPTWGAPPRGTYGPPYGFTYSTPQYQPSYPPRYVPY
jgi:hypothetical protein